MSGMVNCLVVLACVLLMGAAEAQHPLPPSAALPNQHGLAQIFFSSRIMAQDPMLAMACFSDYIAHSNAIGDKYGNDYNQCLTNATNSRQIIDESMMPERNGLIMATAQVCKRMNHCNDVKTNMGMFNCHAGEVSEHKNDKNIT